SRRDIQTLYYPLHDNHTATIMPMPRPQISILIVAGFLSRLPRYSELTTAVDFKRHGIATQVVLPGLTQQNQLSRCDPALIKAAVRGRAWFEELATGRARSLEELAKRDGISRRYILRLIDLAFLSPRVIDAILEGRHPVALTATRLSGFDLPLDWAEQHKLLAS